MPDNEKAKHTSLFLTKLNLLKKTNSWAILLIAHTPKRIAYSPLSKNDIQGSKAFSNLIDSSFAIGESNKGSSIKYIKQIKVRNGSFRYEAKNVLVAEIIKNTNFTAFSYIGESHEFEHLKQVQEVDNSNKKDLAFDMKTKGFTNVHIAKELGVAESTIRKWLKKNKELINEESEKQENTPSHDSHDTNSTNGTNGAISENKDLIAQEDNDPREPSSLLSPKSPSENESENSQESQESNTSQSANDATSESKESISQENVDSKENSLPLFPKSKIEKDSENSHTSHESYTSHSAKNASSDIDSKSKLNKESEGDSENQIPKNNEE
ncbi:MAG: hypothetical protein ACK4ND_18925 [Cytophagaceae bacterium]